MKKVSILLLFLLLSSMSVFAIDHFTMMHHLGPKSTTYGIELKFFTGSNASSKQSEVLTKDMRETASSQYLGQVVGVINNNTEDVQNVYYNIYWTPFYKLKDDNTLDMTKKVNYSVTATPSTDAGKVDISAMGSSKMSADKVGNVSMKLTIPEFVFTAKTVELYKFDLSFTGLDVADAGNYQANLVMEVLSL